MQVIREIFKDKEGRYSLREIATAIFIAVMIISWISEQFFSFKASEYMFYTFGSLVGAGCFSYSLERRTINKNQSQNHENDIQDAA
jgi:hypothetical protein